jgi:peptide/nickel transport system substrate-binding protein/oligopeptide transport system substrate-binding protein
MKDIATRYRAAGRILRSTRLLSQLAVVGLLVSMIAAPACTRQDDTEKSGEQHAPVSHDLVTGGIYRRPLGNDPASLDPARITDYYAVAVANQIFDGLVKFDAHLNVVPALAQSWTASRDGVVWIFNLRRDVQFHNGRAMTAEDVVYSLSRLLDPSVGSPRSWFLDKVKGASAFQDGSARELAGISAVDRYTVQISLSEPFTPFLSILGLPHTSIVPKEEVERLGAEFATAPVGTGAFRFLQWKRDQEITLEANERYFLGRPALDRVRFLIFPGNAVGSMIRAFEQGELEESPIPPERRQELLASNTYTLIRKPVLSLLLFGFNLERPPLNQREVRQAFNYAVDKNRMNHEIQANRYVVARGILPPGMPGYNPEVQGYSYDPDKAKALLAQAGHLGGKGLTPVTIGSTLKSEEIRQESEAVQQYLTNVGVQAELAGFEDWPAFQRALEQGETQIFRYAWYADYPDPDNFLYPLFHSQSANNYFRYRNPTVDALLDEARRETDDLQRVKLYRQAEQLILNDAPGVMFLHRTYEELFQPYIEGIESSALGDPYISLRKVRLKRTRQTNTRK